MGPLPVTPIPSSTLRPVASCLPVEKLFGAFGGVPTPVKCWLSSVWMILHGGINEGLTRSWPASQQCCYAHWVSCEAPRLGTLRIRIVHVRPAPVSHIKSSSHTKRANNSGLKMVITRRNITCYSAVTQSLNHTEPHWTTLKLCLSHLPWCLLTTLGQPVKVRS